MEEVMLGRYYLTREDLTDPNRVRVDTGTPSQLGATAVEWGQRIRSGGFLIAGAALTLALVLWALPGIRIVLKGRNVYKKAKYTTKRMKRGARE